MKPPSAKSCPACGERYEGDVLFCPKDGTPLANTRSASFQSADGDAYVGMELAGQIRIKHLIGIGSMGRVYRAFQAGIERDVAVKVLHRELSGNGELVARFHREAKVASRLVHPNVVQVLMTGTVPFRTDPRVGGEMYLVMEHLDGISLLSALAAAGNTGGSAALPLPRALHIVLQLCDAVGEAHAQGIVHRDLKPENVMLIRRGEDPDYVKVLDFGIARIDWANQSMATQAGLIFGTAKYISPEGAGGEGVGPPADVYSIATILYQCLAGRAPFEDESPVALLVQHTHAVPPELRSIPRASYVPAPIAEVVMQNLAKKPGARAQDARVFGRDLVAAMRASGLDPEEIIAHSTLLVRGAVRLASHARTKSMDMTPELASVIAQASKAPPLPAPPPLVHASPAPTLNDEEVPSAVKEAAAAVAVKEAAAAAAASALAAPPASAPSGSPSPAILVGGARATDTMVVLASELIDVAPPPLPSPPPGDEARESAPAPSAPAAGSTPVSASAAGAVAVSASRPPVSEGAAAVEPVKDAASVSAPPSAPQVEAPSAPQPTSAPLVEATSAPQVVAPAAAETAGAAPVTKSQSEASVAAPVSAPAEAAAASSDPAAPAGASRPPIETVEAAGRASAPAISEAAPEAPAVSVPVPTPPPPSLRTLFDAPAPEAVSAPPPVVAEGPTSGSLPHAAAPVAPERPGGTQVGDSPFEGDSVDTSIPPIASRPGTKAILAQPLSKSQRSPELDWNDEGVKPPFQSTMQGTSVEAPPPRAKGRSAASRLVAIVGIAAVCAVGAVGIGRYWSTTHGAESSDSLDELVEQARECERTRSWDSPPGANVKDITAKALELSPNDRRILDLRRDAAEKIVTEALGRRYAGEREDALRLASLALDLHPTLTTAQHLVAELERERKAEAAASASGSETAEPAPTDHPAASAKATAPRSSGKAALPPSTALPTTSGKGPPSTVAPSKTGKPNTPPVSSGGPAVLPQPTNTGPWL